MKCIFLLSLLFISSAFARTPQLLKCLGAEERRLHLKKDLGPNFNLNQRLMAEIIQIPNASIAPKDLKNICQEQHSESWKLLHLSIIKEKELFVIDSGLSAAQRQVTEGMIEDYIEATKEILLAYISQVQMLAPSPTCLTEEIPQLENFFVEIKYLEGDVPTKKLFEGRDLKIFYQLTDYQKIYAKCLARLKKKLKPASTADPKNN